MDWKDKAIIEERPVEISRFWQVSIRFAKAIDMEKLKEHPDVECTDEPSTPLVIKTPYGSIMIKSKYCAQIPHAKDPEHAERMQKFLYDIVFNGNRRRLIDLVKKDFHKFVKEDLG